MLPEVTLPPDRATGEPKSRPSILNCTAPVGVPEPGPLVVTIAVNDTDWPYTEGLADEETAVVVAAALATCDRVALLLAVKLPSPPYSAVMLCEATDKADVVNVAWPELFRLPEPSVVVPSMNSTVPDGVPEPGRSAVTAAVNVTDWPNTEGFAEDVIVVVVVSFSTPCDSGLLLPSKLVSLP
jgi:hypothetical protein